MEEKEKIDFEKMSLREIEELDLYKLNEDELSVIKKKLDVITNNKACSFKERIGAALLNSIILDAYTTIKKQADVQKIETKKFKQKNSEIKEKVEKLEQENSELKEEVEKLKLQNQQLQNNFNVLLGILSQQNPELEDEFQGLLGASDDIVADTSKGQGYAFN